MSRVLCGIGACWIVVAASPAAADFFFRPFGYAFYKPIPEPEPEPDVSPQRMAAILARHGFRLIGELGYRGQQIVAAGVDARGRRQRFLIDPYEGRVLESWPIGPYATREAPIGRPVVEPYDAAEPSPGDPKVISGLGPDADPPKRAAPKPAASPRAKTAARHSGDAPAHPASHPAPSQSMKADPKPLAPAAPPPSPAAAAKPADAVPSEAKAPAPASTTSAPAQTAPAAASAPQPEAAAQQAAAPAAAGESGATTSAPLPAPQQTPAEQPKTPGPATEADPKANLGG